MTVRDIPALNATLNAASTLLLLAGYVFIKTGNRERHRTCMLMAFVTSAIFLIGYVTHKVLIHGVHTKLGAGGMIAWIYYPMLITHIILAMVMVPMIFMTIARARRKDFEAHRRLARWTWPIWMYVSVTGVLVYLFLYHWWPAVKPG
jgi:putative membrane protein